jgi:NTP pyrophosphatase (non-canonical NTP hydrolase)
MEKVLEPLKEIKELQKLVVEWADQKGLIKPENAYSQFMKMVEEFGELGGAIIKRNVENEIEEFGDVLVTVIVLAEQRNIDLKLALNLAYNKIKDRKGKMVDGSFVKEEPKMHREYTPELDYLSKGA